MCPVPFCGLCRLTHMIRFMLRVVLCCFSAMVVHVTLMQKQTSFTPKEIIFTPSVSLYSTVHQIKMDTVCNRLHIESPTVVYCMLTLYVCVCDVFPPLGASRREVLCTACFKTNKEFSST